MSDRDLDRLVDVIAARVKERLGGGSGGAEAGAGHAHHPHDPSDTHKPCSADKGNCIGCGWSVRRRPKDVAEIVQLGASRVGSAANVSAQGEVPADLARYIDHTLLKHDATRDEVQKLCAEARKHNFATVCVNLANVRMAATLLQGCPVRVCAVVGFPLGATTGAAKAFETREAVRNGASEIDMVINVGALKNRDYRTVLDDITRVVEAAGQCAVKVILETSSLSDHEKVIACALSKTAGAAFVKTSTGFGAGGATAGDVALMKAVVGDEMEVKASGGVRTIDDALAMIKAGATRIGASASVSIVTGKPAESGAAKKTGVGGRRSLY